VRAKLLAATVAVAAAAASAAGGLAGCRRNDGAGAKPAPPPPDVEIDRAVAPDRFATALRKLGRAHFRATTKFEVTPAGGATDTITTDTDLWMDAAGNWRLVETNDKDGGREVVKHGKELGVALRYGKMIRRPAEDPEPQSLLEEGLGGPFAAWDLLREVAAIEDGGHGARAGRPAHTLKLSLAPKPRPPAATVDPRDRRAWRQTLVPSALEGTIAIDEGTGMPLAVTLRGKYAMKRGTDDGAGAPFSGAVDVEAELDGIGTSPDIVAPEAEDLPLRQRTVPEEKALLGGLARTVGR